MTDAPDFSMLDDVNAGRSTGPAASRPQIESALEVVIGPDIELGQHEIAPTASLLRIRHPRHGWLNFLLPKAMAMGVGAALAPANTPLRSQTDPV